MITLNQICDLIVDCEHKTAPVQEQGYPSIRTPNIGRGFFILDGVNRVSEETYTAWTRRAAPSPGDLILAREAPVGNVAVIPEGEKFCLGQRTVLIRPNKNLVDPYYLCYQLLTPDMQSRMHGKSAGATVHHLNLKDIRSMEIPPLPCLEDQKRLAFIIRNYDDLIAINQRRIELLEEAARRLYREWFVHLRFPGHESVPVEDGVPQGWTTQNLIDIAPLSYGKALKASDRKPGNVPVYGSSGVVGYHSAAYVNEGAIIVGRKGNIGSVFLSHTPCFPIDTVFFISPDKVTYWLYFSVQELNFISSDSAVPGLNRNYAHSLPLLLPDTRTIRAFEELATPLFAQIHLLTYQNTRLTQARDLLLPRLMSGKLDVSNIPLPEEVLA